ncbi:MAG: element excision factor XisI family protein [Bacteroidota bacterium]
MDKVNHHKAIVKNIIQSIYDRYEDAPQVYQIIEDEKNGHYLLYRNHWMDDNARLYGTIIHMEVKSDGKVWLHYDGTELIVADRLIKMGIPTKEICTRFSSANGSGRYGVCHCLEKPLYKSVNQFTIEYPVP